MNIMIILAPMSEKITTAKLSARFARAEYFAFIDTETKEIEFVDNPHKDSQHGAASKVLSWATKKGVSVMISDQLGHTAVQVVDSNPNLTAYLSSDLTLDKIADAIINKELPVYPEGEVRSQGSHGSGRGSGRGRN